MVEESLKVLVYWFEVELFFVVIANDHDFEKFWVDVVGEGFYLIFFIEVDDFRSLEGEGLVL